MSLVQEQSEFLKDVALLIAFANRKGWLVTGGELWRPLEMQKIYYKRGKTKTMKSLHLKKLAIDLNFFKPIKKENGEVIIINGRKYQLTYKKEDLEIFGAFWESLSEKNRWGGHFRNFLDTTHFERRLLVGKKKK